jgi:hypothetical protein
VAILIDFVDDTPMVEVVSDEGEGVFARIRTGCPDGSNDSVWLRREDGKYDVIPAGPTARTTTRTAGKAVEFLIHERDFSEHGNYEIQAWTRRGQQRMFHFSLVKVAGDDKKVALIIDPKTSPCSWVVGDDVFPTPKDEKVVVELALE